MGRLLVDAYMHKENATEFDTAGRANERFSIGAVEVFRLLSFSPCCAEKDYHFQYYFLNPGPGRKEAEELLRMPIPSGALKCMACMLPDGNGHAVVLPSLRLRPSLPSMLFPQRSTRSFRKSCCTQRMGSFSHRSSLGICTRLCICPFFWKRERLTNLNVGKSHSCFAVFPCK